MHAIFVHGLNGDFIKTWQSSGSIPEFWPEWLSDDIPGLAVWSLGYAASSSRWRTETAMALPDRAQNLLPLIIREERLGAGQLVFVAHSLGGLVVQQLLRLAEERARYDAAAQHFLNRVRKIIFLSTPQAGSYIANASNGLSLLTRPHPTVKGLSLGDPHLRDLNSWFRGYTEQANLSVLVLRENKPTRFKRWLPLTATVVAPYSADPGLSPIHEIIPVDEDHYSIVSPRDRDSYVYFLTKDFIIRKSTAAPKDKTNDLLLNLAGEVGRTTTTVVDLQTNITNNSTEILDAIAGLRVAKGAFPEAATAGDNPIITAELFTRLQRLKQSRFAYDFDRKAECESLFKDIHGGYLSLATADARRVALAWCARIMSSVDPARAEEILTEAEKFGKHEDVDIAYATNLLFGRNDKNGALSHLRQYDTAAARTAKLLIGGHGLKPSESLIWAEQAGLGVSDIDPDGKLILFQWRIEAGDWDRAWHDLTQLTENDFSEAPILYSQTGTVRLARSVHPELRPTVSKYLPLNLRDFPMGDDVVSLEQRRHARLPGPLEGGSTSPNLLPDEILAKLKSVPEGAIPDASVFAGLVNSALIFQLHPEHSKLAADTLRNAKYQLDFGSNPDISFSLLAGLASVAATTRDGGLAEEVRLFTSVIVRRSEVDIEADSHMRIGLIASAAYVDLENWCVSVGKWFSDIAFNEIQFDMARMLRSHLRVLCDIVPQLWTTCSKADAALSAIST